MDAMKITNYILYTKFVGLFEKGNDEPLNTSEDFLLGEKYIKEIEKLTKQKYQCIPDEKTRNVATFLRVFQCDHDGKEYEIIVSFKEYEIPN